MDTVATAPQQSGMECLHMDELRMGLNAPMSETAPYFRIESSGPMPANILVEQRSQNTFSSVKVVKVTLSFGVQETTVCYSDK